MLCLAAVAGALPPSPLNGRCRVLALLFDHFPFAPGSANGLSDTRPRHLPPPTDHFVVIHVDSVAAADHFPGFHGSIFIIVKRGLAGASCCRACAQG